MKIGIDARLLGSKQGGIGRYIEEIIKAYQSIDQTQDWQFIIFLRRENWDLINESHNLKKVLADIYWYGLQEQIKLPKILNQEKLDLMHFPHWNIPLLYRRPYVVTIHDLLLLHYPSKKASTLGPLKYFFKNIAYKIVLKNAIKQAKHIITPSQFTKNDLIKTFTVAPDKISAIHLAPLSQPLTYKHEICSNEADNDQTILDKYNIKPPYILYVGAAYPHKNLNQLITAWNIFYQNNPEYQLVLAGRDNYFYQKLKKFTQKQFDNPQSVIFTDYITDELLPIFYKYASLYVFPSLYEGFGLPPLEAMQYGIPVISSNAGSLPEVLKSGVIYFNPNNTTEIVSALECTIKDDQMRQFLIQAGYQVIHNFSWENTAKKTLEVYKKMV